MYFENSKDGLDSTRALIGYTLIVVMESSIGSGGL
jgi:hypothetical protein